jgi:hypothetical protein
MTMGMTCHSYNKGKGGNRDQIEEGRKLVAKGNFWSEKDAIEDNKD